MIKVKNRNILNETEFYFTLKIAPKRVINLQKKNIVQTNKTERTTVFIISK